CCASTCARTTCKRACVPSPKSARRASWVVEPNPSPRGTPAMNDIFVAGVGMTPFGRMPDKSVYDLAAGAVAMALAAAGADASDVQAAYYGGATNGSLQGQHSIPGPIAMRRCG